MGIVKGATAFGPGNSGVLNDHCDEGTVAILTMDLTGICDHDRTSQGQRTSRYLERAIRISRHDWEAAHDRYSGNQIPTIPGRGKLIKRPRITREEFTLGHLAARTHLRELADSSFDLDSMLYE